MIAIILCIAVGLAGGALTWPFARAVQHSTDERRARVREGFARNDQRQSDNDRSRAEATARFYEKLDGL